MYGHHGDGHPLAHGHLLRKSGINVQYRDINDVYRQLKIYGVHGKVNHL